ncbi:MAG: lysophospholipase, partial [Planctomycetota bacterium]|nr:lysophospholipase [Planctomycetota bacterium]
MPESIATIDDGIRLRRWTPAGRVRGSFLLLHGMESHSGWFAPVAERLAGAGWASLAHDRTGWGESVGERGHLESYRDFVAETSRIADLALREYGSVRLAGMSWGGMAALYLALRRGWLFDSVHLLNPGFAMAGSRLGRYIPRGVYAFLAGDGRCEIDVGFDAALFTHDPAWRERIEHDPLRVRKTTVSFYVETIKMRRFIMEHAGKRRLPPAWCLLAGGDRMVDNARAAEVCDRSGVRVETIPDRAHSLVLEVPDLVAARLDEQAGEALAAKRSRGKAWIIGGGAIGGAVGTLLAIGGSDVGVLV